MRKMIEYNFPATTFTRSNNIPQQIRHVLTEMDEVQRAITDGESTERVDEELADTYHSLETLFRIMQRDMGAGYVEELFQQIEDKNQSRGYYAGKE